MVGMGLIIDGATSRAIRFWVGNRGARAPSRPVAATPRGRLAWLAWSNRRARSVRVVRVVARSISLMVARGGKASRGSDVVPSSSITLRGLSALAVDVISRVVWVSLSRLVRRACSVALQRLDWGTVSVPERSLPKGSLCSSRSSISRCLMEDRPIMIMASLRAGTHNHEQPAERGKWEDHDTDWRGARGPHWGPRGSFLCALRGCIGLCHAYQVGSYVNTLNSPKSSTHPTTN